MVGNSNICQYLKEKILKNEEKLKEKILKNEEKLKKQFAPFIKIQDQVRKVADQFRRIEALSGSSNQSIKELEKYDKKLLDSIRVSSDLSKKIEREKHSSDNQLSQDLAKQLKEKMEQHGNIFLITQFIENQDMNQLRKVADQLISENPLLIYIVGSIVKNKGIFVVKCGKSIKKDAKQLMNYIVKESEGKGGGRVDMAQAGGCNPEKLPFALSSIREFILNES